MHRQSGLSLRLQADLPGLIRQSRIPGVAVGILRDDQIHVVTAGVLSIDTCVPVTPQASFQLASVTKLFTAALAMQQVVVGRAALDDAVRSHLPSFRLA